MAVPKKKVSRSRRNMRRFAGGNRMETTQLTTCPNCSEPSRPHRICSCGFYAGKAIVSPRKSPAASEQA